MTTAAAHQRPARTVAAPASAWTVRAARSLSLLALPVCVWRLPFAFGYGMGGAAPDPAWWNMPYVLGLSLLTELAALLGLGLVRPWGEVFPAWLPRLGGRRVPPAAVIVPGALAGLLFSALCADWLRLACTQGPDAWPYADGWNVLAMTVSGLMTLWGPLLLALTFAYYRRRR
ncbi:hypothetical protein [Streptomyces sp. NPDC023327]|uniref:hypothetical protein n=1 Tax=Streptomyces sp. NPDC023327 TaxID=3157088 RepID=UPI0033C63676